MSADSKSPRPRRGPPGAQLIVRSGVEEGRRFIVKHSATIGRAEATVLLLDDEVSRQHAEIEWAGPRGYVIRDLGSRNGTLVNGEAIEHCQLNFDDQITVGTVQLTFRRHDPLEEELLSRQRLETLGRLGAGVAHDFNNVIGTVLGNVEFLRDLIRDREGLDGETRECIEDIMDSLQRAAAMTPRLLRIARHEERRHSRVDVSELCGELAKLMRRTFDRVVRIEEQIEPGLWVQGDPVSLHQVIMNLCLNARDAMLPDGGVLSLTAEPIAGNDLAQHPQFDKRKVVVLTVRDNGCGMDDHVRQRVFERFFTTKGKGAGYGIGLSTTQDLVIEHGGVIEVESSLGEGSTFRVLLPAAPAQRETRRIQATPRAAPEVLLKRRGGRGQIMVVDDEEMIHRMLTRTLRRAGYDVISAHNCDEAVAALRGAKRGFDLVLLDIDMPEATGEQTQRELRGIDPGVRIVVLSGHADVARERTLLADGALGVLRKPVHVESLLAEIGRAIRIESVPVVDDEITIEIS
ncbi:MAG: response regulator [Deltaproteobacteria bacterium]|jgi:signal transduction histidine kinase/ActR/RegA family two-component response regulator|nr:response regulator [Deltaproteobacteria bacterium]MBW2533288.1 response regulator [Deltaproteobacteria bacterium]